jgi:glycosyltransferase involved in cell wall biosynthesis
MRLAVYTEYIYRRIGTVVYAERAFALFVAALGSHVDHLRIIGRMDPGAEKTRYALPPDIEVAPLSHYQSLTKPTAVLRALITSFGKLARALDEVDVVWVLGPYPHAIVLTMIAVARRKKVVLGVRQDWPAYVRMRHPNERWLHLAADVLEWIWRRLASRLPVVAVGPELSAKYAHAPAVLELAVSLVPANAVGAPARPRDYSSELRILSVGRLDEEKNPLLLADVLALLQTDDARWRMIVCGEGELEGALASRLRELGVADHAELLGYVAMGEELLDLYRSCHALLHISWTEGFPQVLIEAFSTGLPVIATAVGGVRAGVGEAAMLIPPGDPEAAADALRHLVADANLRARITNAGAERARTLTLEAQTARLASFLMLAKRTHTSVELPAGAHPR